MTTLENLYHGNINPCESERLKNNPEYQKLLTLTEKAQEKLQASLSEEQRRLLDNYIINADELSIVINEAIFKDGFSLAMKIMIEIQG